MRLRVPLLALLAPLFAGCAPAEPAEELRLVQVFPPSGPIYLNQRIDLIFDRPVDPSTVTEDTVRIVDDAGLPVPGTLHASAHSLRVSFEPFAPLSSDLADGSFRPGRRYRLELPVYPRSNALRGSAGELLRAAAPFVWRAVDPDELPPELPTALMAVAQGGPLRLREFPQVEAQAGRIVLGFDRPLYPPSVRLSSFRLEEGLRGGPEVPLRSVRVLAGDDAGPRGSELELRTGRPLRPGLHTLWIAPGSLGPTDAALRPLELDTPPDTALLGPLGERLLPFDVAGGAEDPLLVESFRGERSALAEDPARLGLPGQVDGALGWGPDGLRLPASGFVDFDSLGTLDGPTNRTLQSGGALQLGGAARTLPISTWDFDAWHVPAGTRVWVVLERTTRIRVRGRFAVEGELLVRYGSSVARPPRAADELGRDPLRGAALAAFWQDFEPRLEIEVAGLARLTGRILVPNRPGALAGYVRTRGPLLGDWTGAALHGVQREPGELVTGGPPVLGRLAAVSPFYGFGAATELRGQLHLIGPGPLGLEVLLQTLEAGPSGRLSAWLRPERAAELGPFAELRFAVLLRAGPEAEPGILLERLRLR